MKKRKKQTIVLEDLAQLAKLSKYPEWKTFCRMVSNRVVYQKDHIVGLPEYDAIKLAINKAYDRGVIAGILLMVKNVNTAAEEMEKLAKKED